MDLNIAYMVDDLVKGFYKSTVWLSQVGNGRNEFLLSQLSFDSQTQHTHANQQQRSQLFDSTE